MVFFPKKQCSLKKKGLRFELVLGFWRTSQNKALRIGTYSKPNHRQHVYIENDYILVAFKTYTRTFLFTAARKYKEYITEAKTEVSSERNLF